MINDANILMIFEILTCYSYYCLYMSVKNLINL